MVRCLGTNWLCSGGNSVLGLCLENDYDSTVLGLSSSSSSSSHLFYTFSYSDNSSDKEGDHPRLLRVLAEGGGDKLATGPVHPSGAWRLTSLGFYTAGLIFQRVPSGPLQGLGGVSRYYAEVGEVQDNLGSSQLECLLFLVPSFCSCALSTCQKERRAVAFLPGVSTPWDTEPGVR